MAPFEESRLDDAGWRDALDRDAMLRALAGAGAQVRRALTAWQEDAAGRVGGRLADRPRGVHLAAVGASEIVGDVVDVLVGRRGPVVLGRGGTGPLPGWVGALDLVVATSASGSAAGPVAQVLEAGRRGAQVLTIGRDDSPLSRACAQAHGVHLGVPADPSLARHSRTQLWALLVPTVQALRAVGVVPSGPDDVTAWHEVADRLDEQAEICRPDAEWFVNPAKSLAADLAQVTPMVLGDGALTGVAAHRTCAMLARTARLPSMWGQLPDAAASVIACLGGPLAGEQPDPGADGDLPGPGRDLFADPYLDGPSAPPLGLLLLREPTPRDDGAAIERHDRAQAVRDLAERRGARVLEVVARAGGDLARLADLIALTDRAAAYLAIGHGLDPSRAPHLGDVPLPGRPPA